MEWKLDICGDEAISIPESETCDECAEFAERLSRVEELLRDFRRKTITMTDGDGKETSAVVAGIVTVTTGGA